MSACLFPNSCYSVKCISPPKKNLINEKSYIACVMWPRPVSVCLRTKRFAPQSVLCLLQMPAKKEFVDVKRSKGVKLHKCIKLSCVVRPVFVLLCKGGYVLPNHRLDAAETLLLCRSKNKNTINENYFTLNWTDSGRILESMLWCLTVRPQETFTHGQEFVCFCFFKMNANCKWMNFVNKDTFWKHP